MKGIINLYDHYIPRKLNTHNDFQSLIRARILLGLYTAAMMIILIVLVSLLILIPKSNPNWVHGIAASTLAFVLLLLEVFIFYKASNINISSAIYSMSFFSLTFLGLILTGGWHSPLLLLFFCSPAVSFLVGGRHEGLYVTALVFFTGTCLMLAYQLDFTLFQILAKENIEYIRFAIWIASTSLMVSCLTTYDFLLENSLRHKLRNKY